jgi:hypothetical protein
MSLLLAHMQTGQPGAPIVSEISDSRPNLLNGGDQGLARTGSIQVQLNTVFASTSQLYPEAGAPDLCNLYRQEKLQMCEL